MNKKSFAIVLALVMVISLLPLNVFAAGEHEHDWKYTEIPTSGKHTKSCGCGAEITEECTGCEFTDGCNLCGSELLGIHPMDETGHCKGCGACLDPVWVLKSDETHHWYLCTCGEEYYKEEHVYEDGACECGAEEPKEDECQHSETEQRGPLTVCVDCGEVVGNIFDEVPEEEEEKYCNEGGTKHKWVIVSSTVADCENDGVQIRKCDLCGEEETRTFDATGHNYVDGFCDVCGAEEGCRHEQMTEWEVTVPVSCVTDGEEIRYCQAEDCDYYETRVIKCAGSHGETSTEVVVTIEPTCTEPGEKRTQTTCTVCGKVINKGAREEIPALGHDMTEWEVTVPVSCVTDGEETRYCQTEGCGYTETRVIECAGSHGETSTEVIVTIEPTCTEPGEKRTQTTCTVCGKVINLGIREEIPALGHDMTEWEVVTPAGCVTDGEEIRYCQTEGCGHTETRVIESAGSHGETSTEVIVTIDPTCTEPGEKRTQTTCTVCGKVINLGIREEIPALGHDMTEWEVVTPAGCLTDGEEIRYCQTEGCGHTETRVIECAGSHGETRTEVVITIEPTCTEPGEKRTHVICTVCDKVLSKGIREEIPALGHDFEDGICGVCGTEDPEYVPTVPSTPVKPVLPGFGKIWKGWFDIIKPVFGWFWGR